MSPLRQKMKEMRMMESPKKISTPKKSVEISITPREYVSLKNSVSTVDSRRSAGASGFVKKKHSSVSGRKLDVKDISDLLNADESSSSEYSDNGYEDETPVAHVRKPKVNSCGAALQSSECAYRNTCGSANLSNVKPVDSQNAEAVGSRSPSPPKHAKERRDCMDSNDQDNMKSKGRKSLNGVNSRRNGSGLHGGASGEGCKPLRKEKTNKAFKVAPEFPQLPCTILRSKSKSRDINNENIVKSSVWSSGRRRSLPSKFQDGMLGVEVKFLEKAHSAEYDFDSEESGDECSSQRSGRKTYGELCKIVWDSDSDNHNCSPTVQPSMCFDDSPLFLDDDLPEVSRMKMSSKCNDENSQASQFKVSEERDPQLKTTKQSNLATTIIEFPEGPKTEESCRSLWSDETGCPRRAVASKYSSDEWELSSPVGKVVRTPAMKLEKVSPAMKLVTESLQEQETYKRTVRRSLNTVLEEASLITPGSSACETPKGKKRNESDYELLDEMGDFSPVRGRQKKKKKKKEEAESMSDSELLDKIDDFPPVRGRKKKGEAESKSVDVYNGWRGSSSADSSPRDTKRKGGERSGASPAGRSRGRVDIARRREAGGFEPFPSDGKRKRGGCRKGHESPREPLSLDSDSDCDCELCTPKKSQGGARTAQRPRTPGTSRTPRGKAPSTPVTPASRKTEESCRSLWSDETGSPRRAVASKYSSDEWELSSPVGKVVRTPAMKLEKVSPAMKRVRESLQEQETYKHTPRQSLNTVLEEASLITPGSSACETPKGKKRNESDYELLDEMGDFSPVRGRQRKKKKKKEEAESMSDSELLDEIDDFPPVRGRKKKGEAESKSVDVYNGWRGSSSADSSPRDTKRKGGECSGASPAGRSSRRVEIARRREAGGFEPFPADGKRKRGVCRKGHESPREPLSLDSDSDCDCEVCTPKKSQGAARTAQRPRTPGTSRTPRGKAPSTPVTPASRKTEESCRSLWSDETGSPRRAVASKYSGDEWELSSPVGKVVRTPAMKLEKVSPAMKRVRESLQEQETYKHTPRQSLNTVLEEASLIMPGSSACETPKGKKRNESDYELLDEMGDFSPVRGRQKKKKKKKEEAESMSDSELLDKIDDFPPVRGRKKKGEAESKSVDVYNGWRGSSSADSSPSDTKRKGGERSGASPAGRSRRRVKIARRREAGGFEPFPSDGKRKRGVCRKGHESPREPLSLDSDSDCDCEVCTPKKSQGAAHTAQRPRTPGTPRTPGGKAPSTPVTPASRKTEESCRSLWSDETGSPRRAVASKYSGDEWELSSPVGKVVRTPAMKLEKVSPAMKRVRESLQEQETYKHTPGQSLNTVLEEASLIMPGSSACETPKGKKRNESDYELLDEMGDFSPVRGRQKKKKKKKEEAESMSDSELLDKIDDFPPVRGRKKKGEAESKSVDVYNGWRGSSSADSSPRDTKRKGGERSGASPAGRSRRRVKIARRREAGGFEPFPSDGKRKRGVCRKGHESPREPLSLDSDSDCDCEVCTPKKSQGAAHTAQRPRTPGTPRTPRGKAPSTPVTPASRKTEESCRSLWSDETGSPRRAVASKYSSDEWELSSPVGKVVRTPAMKLEKVSPAMKQVRESLQEQETYKHTPRQSLNTVLEVASLITPGSSACETPKGKKRNESDYELLDEMGDFSPVRGRQKKKKKKKEEAESMSDSELLDKIDDFPPVRGRKKKGEAESKSVDVYNGWRGSSSADFSPSDTKRKGGERSGASPAGRSRRRVEFDRRREAGGFEPFPSDGKRKLGGCRKVHESPREPLSLDSDSDCDCEVCTPKKSQGAARTAQRPRTPGTSRTPRGKAPSTPVTPASRKGSACKQLQTPTLGTCKRDMGTPQTPLQEAMTRLHVSAVPKTLPGREKEFRNIFNFLHGKIMDGAGGCMYISGVPGTGKTATVHEVVCSLKQEVMQGRLPEFQFVEVNGMSLPKPQQVYVEIWKALTLEVLTAEQARRALEDKFTKSVKKNIPTVLLADEFDQLWTRRQDVIYNLLEWPSKAGSQLAVVTIANTMDLPERMFRGRVTSRLGLTRLTFHPYNFRQLEEIVKSRLKGLNAFDDDAVQFVARKVASVSGDARRALDICRRATELAEEESPNTLVCISHIDAALGVMTSTPAVQVIVKGCNLLQRLFLQAVDAELNRTGLEETTLERAYYMMETFCSLEGVQLPTLSLTSVICMNLSCSRLLLVKDFRSGIHTRISLNISSDDLHYALRKIALKAKMDKLKKKE